MNTTYLSRDAIRRILLSLVIIQQDALIKKGALSKAQTLRSHVVNRNDAEIDILEVNEDSLGFYSLSRLDLVLAVSQFFQLQVTGVEDYLLIKQKIGDWVDLVERHFELIAENAQIAFQTSGSTGAPKTVIHDLRALRTEVEALLSGPIGKLSTLARVISLVPPHHIYGFLFSCLLPSMTGNDTISLYHRPPTRSLALAKGGDLVVATPFIWEKLAQSGLQFQPDVIGISSASPTTKKTWSVLDKPALSGLIEIYGATETGGIGFRTTFDTGFELLPHLECTNQMIRAKNTAGTSLDIQDELTWIGPREFKINGRLDHVVQIAGVNVSPVYVVRVIKDIAGVKDANVQFHEGRLQALIVPMQMHELTDALAERVRNEIVRNLPAPARPATIRFSASLQYTDMGKVVDWIQDMGQSCNHCKQRK
ncbi:4-coumarate--CoA ligase [Yoonia sp.]|uniref:4-coumarate--CoA ligase n=1 Tax=Yoonia sp. TaxID=2212373 RepID=UPI00358FA4B0